MLCQIGAVFGQVECDFHRLIVVTFFQKRTALFTGAAPRRVTSLMPWALATWRSASSSTSTAPLSPLSPCRHVARGGYAPTGLALLSGSDFKNDSCLRPLYKGWRWF